MKRTFTSAIIIAAAALMTVGCQKDNKGMQLVAEGFGGSKAAVDSTMCYWVDGETVNINGATKTVVVSGNTAYAEDVDEADVYRALYPASLNSTFDGSSDNVTVTIPASYTWAVDAGGRQRLDLPMAARGTSGSRLVFQHLTAAVTVEITNHYGFAIQVDSVVVGSEAGTHTYQLCGSKAVTLANSDISIPPTESASNTKVKVLFNGGTSLKIDQGATRRVQVPVLPVGDGNKFTVSVSVHKDGNSSVAKTYTRTQATGGPLARRKMAFAGQTVGFTFSVAADRNVIISQGNLQYQASTSTWRFAESQAGYIGNAAGNTTAAADRPTQSDWIDLLGWGTSGYNNKYPYMTSGNNNDYGDGSNDIAGTNYDWGVYNTISNGGTDWRTPTTDEWVYLFDTRSASTVSGTADARFAQAYLFGTTHGIIIFPGNYTHPAGVDNPIGVNVYDRTIDAWNGNRYNAADWAKMEAEGCVFLPAAGRRINGTQIDNSGGIGLYWSSSFNSGYNAYHIIFGGNLYSQRSDFGTKSHGLSVRLVKDI